MRKGQLTSMMVLIALTIIMTVSLTVLASESITLGGKVNESYQVVSNDGQIYEVADTIKGNDLVDNHIGQKTKLTGTIKQDCDDIIIKVTNFQILEE